MNFFFIFFFYYFIILYFFIFIFFLVFPYKDKTQRPQEIIFFIGDMQDQDMMLMHREIFCGLTFHGVQTFLFSDRFRSI